MTAMVSSSLQFEPLLSDTQAGDLLGLHPKTVQRLARAGDIPALRIGRYWRFRASELNEWLETLATGRKKPSAAVIKSASQPVRISKGVN
jgi:excisionase family DNA binding protein